MRPLPYRRSAPAPRRGRRRSKPRGMEGFRPRPDADAGGYPVKGIIMSKPGGETLTVRLATEKDHAPCARIFLAARQATFHWQPPESFRLADYDDTVRDDEVWVAEIDVAVVGFASIDLASSFIHDLFVDPSRQRRGVGTRLLERVNGAARLLCLAANGPALTFYRRNGWAEEARGKHERGPFVVFRKLPARRRPARSRVRCNGIGLPRSEEPGANPRSQIPAGSAPRRREHPEPAGARRHWVRRARATPGASIPRAGGRLRQGAPEPA